MLLNPAHLKYDYRDYWFDTNGNLVGASGVSVGGHTNAPPQVEFSTFGFHGQDMGTAGDETRFTTTLPKTMDWSQPVNIRVLYETESANSADTITWIVLFKILAWNSGVLAAPTTALNTVIPAHTIAGVANTIQKTAVGVIDADTFSMSNVRQGDLVVWQVDHSANVGIGEAIRYMGLRFEFYQKLHLGHPVGPYPGNAALDELYRGDADAGSIS